jgi:hypothetical protein
MVGITRPLKEPGPNAGLPPTEPDSSTEALSAGSNLKTRLTGPGTGRRSGLSTAE